VHNNIPRDMEDNRVGLLFRKPQVVLRIYLSVGISVTGPDHLW